MNAADRRHLTPAFGIGAVVLALLLIALWTGLGRGVGWNDPAAPAKLPPVAAATPPPSVPPLEQYREVWQHPLFSPTRTPGPATGAGRGSSGELELTGVIMLPGLKMAILHDRSTGKDYRIVEGEPSRGGPVLVALHPRSAVVEASGSRLQLHLIPGPSPSAGNAPAGTAAPEDESDSGPDANAGQGASAMVTRHGTRDSRAGRVPGSGATSAQARSRELKARIEQARLRRAQQDGGG